MANRRNLLVTLADKNFIQQAKQLFSSVYWNAGWEGDYMLLSHEIPEEELLWFRDKKILIKKCRPLYNEPIRNNYAPVVINKFCLFTEEFKKWGNIIYLDSDIIVKAPLDRLTKIKYFGAVKDSDFNKLYTQFYEPRKFKSQHKTCNLNTHIFNSGVISFNTDIITPNMFRELNMLLNDYISESKTGEQPILNLYFYKKWEKLPLIYNTFIMRLNYKIPKILKTIIIHFIRHKGHPNLWEPGNSFYQEWKTCLEKAEFIDLNVIQKAKKWNNYIIKYYSALLRIYYFTNINRNKLRLYYFSTLKPFYFYLIESPDRIIGNIGKIIKKINPDLYNKLKKK